MFALPSSRFGKRIKGLAGLRIPLQKSKPHTFFYFSFLGPSLRAIRVCRTTHAAFRVNSELDGTIHANPRLGRLQVLLSVYFLILNTRKNTKVLPEARPKFGVNECLQRHVVRMFKKSLPVSGSNSKMQFFSPFPPKKNRPRFWRGRNLERELKSSRCLRTPGQAPRASGSKVGSVQHVDIIGSRNGTAQIHVRHAIRERSHGR